MKHMILPFKMKGDVRSDHFLMLWFQKKSLDTVGFRTLMMMMMMVTMVMTTRAPWKKKKKKEEEKTEKKKPWQASGEGESVRTGAPRLLLPVSPATLQHWKTFSFPSCSYEKVLKFNTLYRPTTGGRLYQHFSFFKSFSTCLLSLNNLLH